MAWPRRLRSRIDQQKQEIADQVQRNKNGLTVAENKEIGTRLTAAYNKATTALSLPKATEGKAETVYQAFKDLTQARKYKGSDWHQSTRELGRLDEHNRHKEDDPNSMVNLLKAYKTDTVDDPQGYQRLKEENLIWPDTLKKVEPAVAV